jgi:hypothetical protein
MLSWAVHTHLRTLQRVMAVFPAQTPVKGTISTSLSTQTVWVKLVSWDNSAGIGGAYVDYAGTLSGSYTVKVNFVDGTARSSSEYCAENTTLVFNATTGTSLPVTYFVFKTDPIDPNKKMTVQLSNPSYRAGWPNAAAMPLDIKDSMLEIRPYEKEVASKKTQVTMSVSYTIPNQKSLCSSSAMLQDSIGKVSKKTATGSNVSVQECVISGNLPQWFLQASCEYTHAYIVVHLTCMPGVAYSNGTIYY